MTLTMIDRNLWFAMRLRWMPDLFGATAFNESLIDAIVAYQEAAGLTVDGVCGPITYTKLIDLQLKRLITNLEDAGRIAMLTAKRLWLNNIVDSMRFPASIALIDEMVRSEKGSGWAWEPPYTPDGPEWCLMFAARCWYAAGVPLADRKYGFPSTYRMDRWARYMPPSDVFPNKLPAEGPPRMMIELDETSTMADARFPDGTMPRAGDILLVGGRRTGPGKHGTIIEEFDMIKGHFLTIEGNATGQLASGTSAHGVIITKRQIGGVGVSETTYIARRVIRPGGHDIQLGAARD